MTKRAFLSIVLLLGAGSAQGQSSKRTEFLDFQKNVDKIVKDGSAAAKNTKEREDFRTLQWLSRDLSKAIDAGNWTQAASIKDRVKVVMHRAGLVADDAPRRKAEQERLQRERQHREEMRQRERQAREATEQRERHHRELMNRLRP